MILEPRFELTRARCILSFEDFPGGYFNDVNRLVTGLGSFVIDAVLRAVIHVQDGPVIGFLLLLPLPLLLMQLLLHGKLVLFHHIGQVFDVFIGLFEQECQPAILLLVNQLPVALFIFRLRSKHKVRKFATKSPQKHRKS